MTAGCAAEGAARNSFKTDNAMKFIHLTDLHLVPPGQLLYGLDPNERLQAAIADINTNQHDADFALITGDLTHDGEPEAYAALKAALAKLATPYHLLLGNHDIRSTFREIFPGTPADENGFVQSVTEIPEGALVLLDTLEAGTHEGHLCEKRLSWLERALSDLRDEPVLLALHHPPLPLSIPTMDTLALRQGHELTALLTQHGHIRHMFFGHVHRPVHGIWHGIPFSTLRGLNHQVAMHTDMQSGIPGSHEPPAYAVVSADQDSIVVNVHDFLDTSRRFDLFDRSC